MAKVECQIWQKIALHSPIRMDYLMGNNPELHKPRKVQFFLSVLTLKQHLVQYHNNRMKTDLV